MSLTYTYNGDTCTKTKTVNVKIPTGEDTSWLGWKAAIEERTVGQWYASLTPSTVDCSGISITEEQGESSTDTCWFVDCIFDPAELSGGPWTVKNNNLWLADLVGFPEVMVEYYRNHSRAPCGFTIDQDMKIVTSSGNIKYTSHTIGSSITDTTVTSSRDGKSKTKTF